MVPGSFDLGGRAVPVAPSDRGTVPVADDPISERGAGRSTPSQGGDGIASLSRV